MTESRLQADLLAPADDRPRGLRPRRHREQAVRRSDGVDRAGVAQRAIELVVEALDVNALLARMDLNAVLVRVELNGLLGRVDINQVRDRVDRAG